MSQFQTLKVIGKLIPGYAGEAAGMTLFTVGFILWFLIPLYDTKTKAGLRARNATYFGIAVIAILVLTTLWGYAALGG